ncbi:TolC family protein [Thiomicrorhabdus sp. Kp2]|uniref:TolC family protein n=1 Tax=Thiomicrorhabdus sp. Kp2 TaxID=1123518 RepID=UPI00041DEEDB|nr:TolC family protein [Thiomicrorhabdus sp. Kp2]
MMNRLIVLLFSGAAFFSAALTTLPVFANQAVEPIVFKASPLKALFNQALANNPSLFLAQAMEQTASSYQQETQSLLEPKVGFQSELSYAWMKNKDFARTSNQLQATIPLYQPDKSNLIEMADHEYKASTYQREAEEQRLFLNIAELYFDYWQKEAEFEFLQKEKASIYEILQQLNRRFQIGYQDLNDIVEIQARLDTNQSDLINAKLAMGIAKTNLEELVGTAITLTDQVFPENLPESLLNQTQLTDESDWFPLVNSHPEIQLIKAQQTAIRESISYAKNRDGLQIEAFSALVYNDSNGNFYDDMQGVRAGVRLELPLYTGGGTDAAIAKARGMLSQAKAKEQQKILMLRTQAKQSFIKYQALNDALQSLNASLSSTRLAKEATENGLVTGSRNLLDLLNAQRQTHKIERDIPVVKAQIWKSWHELRWALGLL